MKLGILLVEDEAAHALALRQALESLGHQVLAWARDGVEANLLRQETNPDLALVDIHLPTMDGIQAAQVMNRHQPLPVVLITGYAGQVFLDRAREAGVYSYLTKPVEAAVLGPAIEIAYQNFQRVQDLEQQVTDLREEIRARKIIERAKGLLMDSLGLGEAEAMTRLQQEARRLSLRLVEVAEGVITAQGLFKPPHKE